ncbi:3-hydroxyacyl-[acyl-carrier-protein] dehydratase [Dyadobacter sp. BE34]|uniref:3-hydroxyacyl-[acyl-carrier-protein] dehydratase n=1 Tax=Dyadobacter fermentans TaxID=94254 RepID=A0ABU1R5T5_9BACT|nr:MULTISPECIES: 3-hydroxyacyl-ACP dehydratase [Dyadobacter]MDR6808774.1 3-hydroxyacyl-[acyl-carrier-protein] dehydratase [Dyadobacter fermentans]MDR7046517.1 3-hydroxyacyl-[acyl-carrier-protein] dehydratase [Dyadobacter sp. BE242]MDR7200830.1 3-hydroxyacyl-[acyl-carrier-protein] dehydratase [Dyadobacter sp. BE34]MDR7218790.1 3-hydroxyacyl-[acyl-carrier-protein] dehydratase [Dyadobacter sp. BE31]MDR7266720.1 3-hydroxyacyl-[acyl-carrier-protein] dehydratase [Dyadobacter sp. BE32]
MPLSNLYTITTLEQTPEQINCTLQIDAAHPVFQGHFPGSPVLPGVVQLEMVKAVLSKALGKAFALKEMSTCKFLEVLNPTETPQLTIQIQYKGVEPLDVNAVGKHGEKTYFKARASFQSII